MGGVTSLATRVSQPQGDSLTLLFIVRADLAAERAELLILIFVAFLNELGARAEWSQAGTYVCTV